MTGDRGGAVDRRLFPQPVFLPLGDTCPRRWVTRKEKGEGGEPEERRKGFSAGVPEGCYRRSQAELQEQEQIDGGAHGVGAARKVTQAVEPFEGEGQAGQPPDPQPTVALVVAEVLEAVAVWGVVASLVLDFPAALGPAEDGAAAHPVARKVGEPVGLVHLPVGLVLPIADHPHRLPSQRVPRVKVVGVPDFHPVLPRREDLLGRLATQPFLGGRESFGEMVLQADDDGESQIVGVVQEGSAGEFPLGHPLVGKAATGIFEGAAQEPAGGVVLTIPGTVGFDIPRQRQTRSHPTDQSPLRVVTEDLALLIPVGTAQLTNLLA